MWRSQRSGGLPARRAAQVHLPAMPSVAYTAVRPGTAVLILVGLPCRSLRPAHGAPTGYRRRGAGTRRGRRDARLGR